MSTYIELKKGEKYALPTGISANTTSHFKDASLILKKNEVVVDIDAINGDVKECANYIFENIVKTKIIQTDRGLHLYFKKPNSKLPKQVSNCNLGINVEYKTDKVVVKRNNRDRVILFDVNILPTLPIYFLPNKRENNLFGLSDGDGRNNKLYSFLMGLNSSVFDIEIIKEFINNFVFETKMDGTKLKNMKIKNDNLQGILKNTDLSNKIKNDKEKLKKEVDTDKKEKLKKEILKDEKKLNDEIKKVKISNRINEFIDIHKFKFCKYENNLYFYNETYWCKDHDLIIKYLNNNFQNKQSLKRELEELYFKLSLSVDVINDEPNFIKFKNGIFKKGCFYEIETNEFTPYFFDFNYNESKIDSDILDKFFTFITQNNNELIDYLYFIPAISMCIDFNIKNKYQNLDLLIGDGENGKGLYIKLIGKLFNKDQISYVPLNKIKDNTFKYTLYSSLINISDEVQEYDLNRDILYELKLITSHEPANVRELYKNSIVKKPKTRMLLTSNHIPVMSERGHQIERRFNFIEFNAHIKNVDDKYFDELFSDQTKEVLFNRIINKLKELYTKVQLLPTSLKKYNQEYAENNNYYYLFSKEYDLNGILGNKFLTKSLFDTFLIFLENAYGLHKFQISLIKFNKEIQLFLPEYKKQRIGGQMYWVKKENE